MKKRKELYDSTVWEIDINDLTWNAADIANSKIEGIIIYQIPVVPIETTEDADFEIIQPKQLPPSDAS